MYRYLIENNIVQTALRHVVFTVTVAPVLYITVSIKGLDYNLLFGFTKSQNKKYLVAGRYIQSFAELLPLHCTNHAATQTFLSRT